MDDSTSKAFGDVPRHFQIAVDQSGQKVRQITRKGYSMYVRRSYLDFIFHSIWYFGSADNPYYYHP